ncbi:MAG TPA: lytic murein transglycosylase B [Caldimonas sp.]
MDLHPRRRLVLGGTAWLLSSCAGAAPRKRAAAKPVPAVDDNAPDGVGYGARDDVVRFADEVAERRGLDPEWLRNALAQARFQPLVVRYIMPSATGAAKNWNAYRARFVEPIRIRAGVEFWRENDRWLTAAEDIYGVPPEVVVGIVGVETIYGRQMGNFRIIDALATLAFDFPAGRSDRSAFFRDELENWFVLCKSEGVDPLSWRGSYAGAIGMAQFMPSSFNRFAVDFDGDGRVDLHASAADAIGSVANYLAEFGWKRGLPARFDVEPPTETSERAALLAPDIVPTFTAAEMVERGARLPAAALAVESLFALIELQNGDAAPTYVAGTTNFYTLTRYNWSSYYAMAVLALGEAVRPAALR